MNSRIARTAAYTFLMLCLCTVTHPVHAEVTETLCHIKDRACSSTGVAVGLGVWCCGVTYWCLTLQKKVHALEKKVESEQKKRRSLKDDLGCVNKLMETHSEGLLESEKNFLDLKKRVEPIELALYGVSADDTQKNFRLSILSKFMESQSSVIVQACGRIEMVNSSQNLADFGQESSDSPSPMGDSLSEGSVSPVSREGSVSLTHESTKQAKLKTESRDKKTGWFSWLKNEFLG